MSLITRRAMTFLVFLILGGAPLLSLGPDSRVAFVWGPSVVSAQDARPAWEFGVRGILLMNAYHNDALLNSPDDPAFAAVPTPGLAQEGLGTTLRQTRIVGTGDLAGFAGGAFHAELDVDFFGATNTGGTRTGPAVRIRRMIGEVRWDRWSSRAELRGTIAVSTTASVWMRESPDAAASQPRCPPSPISPPSPQRARSRDSSIGRSEASAGVGGTPLVAEVASGVEGLSAATSTPKRMPFPWFRSNPARTCGIQSQRFPAAA